MSFDKAKEALAGVTKATPPEKTKSGKATGDRGAVYGDGLTPGDLARSKNIAVTTGPVGEDSRPLSMLKAAAYAAGLVDADQVKPELALSAKVKAAYGLFYPFENTPRSVFLPSSAKFLPEKVGAGYEIPGAKALKAEVGERLKAGMGDFDPERGRAMAEKAGQGEWGAKALATLSDIAGGSFVPPPMLGDMIDLQRNIEAFNAAGARSVDLPPSGRIAFPKLNGGATAYWVGETGSVTESQQTTGQLNLEAKKLAARVPVTNELLKYGSVDIEAMIRVDMARVAALKADLAMLEGTGGTQIKGLITYPSASSWTSGTDRLIAYTSVNVPGDGNTGYLWQPDDVYGMESALPDGVSPTAWVGRKNFWGKALNRRADAVSAADGKGLFMFEPFRGTAFGPQPSLAGAKIVRSSQVSNTRVRGSAANLTYTILGDFADWIVARLGVLEFMVDPYTQAQNWQTVVQAVQLIDAGPRHLASFAFCDQLQVA